MARIGMAVDLDRCVGCQACAVACTVEHEVPEPYVRRRVGEVAIGEERDVRVMFVHLQCAHCDVPACTSVCPTGATWIDRNGVCVIDAEVCIGCRACVSACPYGARYPHPDGYVDKCNLCEHRRAAGRPPACVETCPAQALSYGDLDDPRSDVSRALRAALRIEVDRPDAGTRPKLFFLNGRIALAEVRP